MRRGKKTAEPGDHRVSCLILRSNTRFLGRTDRILGPFYRDGETEALQEQMTFPSFSIDHLWQIVSLAQPVSR